MHTPNGVWRRAVLFAIGLALFLYAISFLPWQNLVGPWSGF
jgi:hypothetical protein